MNKTICVILLTGIMGSAVLFSKESGGLGFRVSPYNRSYNSTNSTLLPDYVYISTTMADWGIYAYLDMVYVQLEIGYSQMMYENTGVTVKNTSGGNTGAVSRRLYSFINYLDISAFVKYPIQAGRVTISPAAGVSFRTNLAARGAGGMDLKENASNNEKYDFYQFWIKAGVFLDIPISPKWYIRPAAMIGYRIKTSLLDEYDPELRGAGTGPDYFSLGGDFSISVGYIF